ncbi:DUF3300 domain-containing protein [Shewanella insulae]|uniref:DUF3300 domain-containing protein n=1 Tax=Shewanella insulae TaxID=2681496 RepID=UPI001EFDDE94|nr:DUF3300 domain-containing protein [Shewanella insulae]MCG9712129.1 DUF3300 domain-containing protein [Shewanella insulae]
MKSIRQWTLLLLIALSQSLLTPSVSRAEDAVQEIQFSDAELAQMLAPIALYPDSLLTHILIASTYPLEVVQANRWRNKHKSLEGAETVNRAEKQDWDPSVTALVAFPDLLQRLNDDLEWTQKLGDAFLQNEGRVLDSIQHLRQQAERANAFDDMENMRVTKVNRQIVIEPVQREVIYVPYYDTRVVYGHWHWYNYPPVYWAYPPRYTRYYPGHISGHFYFNSGIHISFNYFFSAFSWHRRHIVVTHHHHTNRYRPHSRIVTSNGAQRWHHKPVHRHGVAYRSPKVKARYGKYRHNRYDVKHNSSVNRYSNSKQAKPSHAKHYNAAQVQKRREQKFSHKLSDARGQHDRRQNAHKAPTKYYEKRDRLSLNDQANRSSSTKANNRAKDWNKAKSHQRDIKSHQPKSYQREKNHQRGVKIPQREMKSHQPKSYQRERSHQRDIKSHQRDIKSHQRDVKSPQRARSHHANNGRGASSHSQQGRTKQRDN